MRTMIQLLLALLATGVFAQNPPPRLIVRVDDMGCSHAVNEAILKCYTEGIATSVEVLVPSPWFPEAVKIVTEHPEVDVGVHLALSSEWDNIKWRPVSDCPSLRDADGYFFPRIFRHNSYAGRSLVENHGNPEDVEKEFRAQIELARKKIPQISHLSGHMNCCRMNNDVKALVERLGKEYGLYVETDARKIRRASCVGPQKTSDERIESFINMLEDLEAGQTYLFVDHPGLDTSEMRAIYHTGYEDVATSRQTVTDTLTSARVCEAIKTKRIQLIGYRDLKK
ncbi:MAG: polysaccharide deacetylase family protein [Verrucomicrobiia bacterium]